MSVDNKHLCVCSRAQRAVSIPTEGQVKDMAPVLISCADQLAWPGTGLVWTGLMYGHAGALFLTLGLKCRGERANESERDWKGMREALSRMKMFYPRSFSPSSLPLSHPLRALGEPILVPTPISSGGFGPVIRLYNLQEMATI